MTPRLQLWLSLAKPKYPSLSESEIETLRLQGSVEWLYDRDTELCKLYDSYVMMKKLLE